MTASPNRVLARVVLTALALAGFLLLVALELLILSLGRAGPTAIDLRCLLAPVSSIDTAVHASAVAIGLLAALPILRGARAARRARSRIAELRRLAGEARLASPAEVVAAATAAQIAARIDVVDATRPFAFAYGWIRPRVCISTGLVQLLEAKELEAVLHHEGWHVVRRDPLRLLLAQTVGAAFAIVPEIRRLVQDYLLAIEVAADQHVVATMGTPQWLASALIKILTPPAMRPAFEGDAEARVAALSGSVRPAPRWRGRVAAAALILELAILIPLLSNGSLVALFGLWIHPVC